MLEQTKAIFKRKASNNNGGIQVNIPPEIADHLDITQGETLALQTEHSTEYDAPYVSIWNHTQQSEEQ